MSIYTEGIITEYDEKLSNLGGKKGDKIRRDSTKHYPNKDEAQALRKIMATTGLSEEEVRQDKTHRKTLAEAQKAGQKAKRKYYDKRFQDLIKQACKQTGLVPQHPETLKVLQEMIDKRISSSFGGFWLHRMNAETLVKTYAK